MASQFAAVAELTSRERALDMPSSALNENTTQATSIAARYQSEGINFTIFRDGRRVGKHSVRFLASGAELAVKIDSTIRITILKIPVFTLRYTASEFWQGDQLISAEATTRENKNSTTVSLDNQGDQSTLATPEGTMQVMRLSYASNHWNHNILTAGRFFNTLTGEASDVSIKHMGKDTIATTSGMLSAEHYVYSGDVVTEVWYDSAARWVGLAFNADDGSRIRYELNN